MINLWNLNLPGMYPNLPSEDYHGHKQSISRSALMDFKKNPRKYWAKHLNPDRPKEESKPSWTFGTAFHTLILEPHLFEQNYFVMPEKVLLKDVGREAYDEYKRIEQEASSTSRIVLSQCEFLRLRDMQDRVQAHPKASALISGGIFESSYFWKDVHSGLMIKSRPDILHSNIYVDLKTIDDASPQNFQREMVKYGYHIQGAMVRDGVEQLTNERISAVINICVEKTYPYSIGIYIIDEAAIDEGHMQYKQALLDLKHAIGHNEFPDYDVCTIGLPKWAL